MINTLVTWCMIWRYFQLQLEIFRHVEMMNDGLHFVT